MSYQDLVNEFSLRPREVPTAPISGAPKWFYTFVRGEAVFVSSGREQPNACRIRGARQLNRGEFEGMLSLYHRRKRGEGVSREASALSINQSYWYGIFREMGE